ncbi:unnamed protein product, partial [Prorocentrum cordatum]
MPVVCTSCGCKKNLDRYKWCMHCWKPLPKVQFAEPSAAVGAWRRGGKTGGSKSNTAATKPLDGQRVDAFAAMSEEHYAYTALLLTHSQCAQVAAVRAQRSGDPHALSKAAQQEHGQLKAKLAAVDNKLSKAAIVFQKQLQRVVELRLEQKSLQEQERQVADRSRQAWIQIAGEVPQGEAEAPERIMFQRFQQLDPSLAMQFNQLFTAKAQAEHQQAAQRVAAAPPPAVATLVLPGDMARAAPVQEVSDQESEADTPRGDDDVDFGDSWADEARKAASVEHGIIASLSNTAMVDTIAPHNGAQPEQVQAVLNDVLASAGRTVRRACKPAAVPERRNNSEKQQAWASSINRLHKLSKSHVLPQEDLYISWANILDNTTQDLSPLSGLLYIGLEFELVPWISGVFLKALPQHRAYVRSVVIGAQWPMTRQWKAGYPVDTSCIACLAAGSIELGTPAHRHCSCAQHALQFEEPHVSALMCGPLFSEFPTVDEAELTVRARLEDRGFDGSEFCEAVRFVKVPAHSSSADARSGRVTTRDKFGNDMADRHAKWAAQAVRVPPPQSAAVASRIKVLKSWVKWAGKVGEGHAGGLCGGGASQRAGRACRAAGGAMDVDAGMQVARAAGVDGQPGSPPPGTIQSMFAKADANDEHTPSPASKKSAASMRKGKQPAQKAKAIDRGSLKAFLKVEKRPRSPSPKAAPPPKKQAPLTFQRVAGPCQGERSRPAEPMVIDSGDEAEGAPAPASTAPADGPKAEAAVSGAERAAAGSAAGGPGAEEDVVCVAAPPRAARKAKKGGRKAAAQVSAQQMAAVQKKLAALQDASQEEHTEIWDLAARFRQFLQREKRVAEAPAVELEKVLCALFEEDEKSFEAMASPRYAGIVALVVTDQEEKGLRAECLRLYQEFWPQRLRHGGGGGTPRSALASESTKYEAKVRHTLGLFPDWGLVVRNSRRGQLVTITAPDGRKWHSAEEAKEPIRLERERRVASLAQRSQALQDEHAPTLLAIIRRERASFVLRDGGSGAAGTLSTRRLVGVFVQSREAVNGRPAFERCDQWLRYTK